MARIRTIKPDFFRHEELYEAEQETGFPLRLAFAGLFTVSDREGRFRWQPRQIKLDVMPYDQLDFSRVLDALVTRGFVVRYACGTDEYGVIPSFTKHQVINNREKPSEYPDLTCAESIFPYESIHLLTRAPRVPHACLTPLVQDQGEGKGREGEGKGKGRELHVVDASIAKPKAPSEKTPIQIAAAATWSAYSGAYFSRYGTEPVRNQAVNSQVTAFVKRIGTEDAPHVATYFVGMNKRFYIEKLHPMGLLLADCEAIRTQWATNHQVTSTRAGQMDQSQANYDLVNEALAILAQQGGDNANS
jgi:hypothetical protein